MIKVSLEVHERTTPFRVAVQAESIGQAVSIVKERYPGHEVRVVFPIDSEEFFIEGSVKRLSAFVRPYPLRTFMEAR